MAGLEIYINVIYFNFCINERNLTSNLVDCCSIYKSFKNCYTCKTLSKYIVFFRLIQETSI